MEQNIKDTDVIKCQSCGANMRFSIKNNALKCSHCGAVQQIENSDEKVVRRDMSHEILNQFSKWDDSMVFGCSNCGAKVDLDKKEIVKNCPFCGSPNILKTDELVGIKPDSIVPFTITKQTAAERFKKWIGSKFFAPKKCKKNANVNNINGLYFPTWSFSADTQNYYDGVLGEDYTVTVKDSNGNEHTETHTRWFKVSGNIETAYRDYLVPSGKLLPKSVITALGTYPINTAKAYKQEYLVGRSAEHYSRDIKICFGEFERHIYSDLCLRIKRLYRADHVKSMSINTTYNKKQFNYILLPVYTANFQYNNKNYNFYINGTSGKITGSYPKSGRKIFFTVFAIVAAVAAVVGIIAIVSGAL
ncbi:MAG: hypothetical protein FWG51_02390 [Firmicutes bacterium]|nr:hypothetical protein [Bacillota bacterium]